jgi:hypothetical protein
MLFSSASVTDENVVYFRGPVNIFVGRPTRIRKVFSSASGPTKMWVIFVGLSQADENKWPVNRPSGLSAHLLALARPSLAAPPLAHASPAREEGSAPPHAAHAPSPRRPCHARPRRREPVAAVAKKGARRPSTPRPPSVHAALVPRGEPPRLPSSFDAHGGRGVPCARPWWPWRACACRGDR